MWKTLFGRYYQNAAPKTTPNKLPDSLAVSKSIIALKDTQKLLDKKEEQLEKEVAKLVFSAKEKLNKSNRQGALYDLKRKKILDKHLSLIVNKKLNIERQIGALGSAALNSSIYESLKEGVKALRNENSIARIDEVEELMEKHGDLMERQDAIDEALSRDLNTDIGDDELLKELEDLEDEVENELDALELPEPPNQKLVGEENNRKTVLKRRDSSLPAGPKKLDEKHLPIKNTVYHRPKVKDKHMSMEPFSKKRKLEKLEAKEAEKELSPAPKKKRLGFSFPKRRRFPRLELDEKELEPIVKREQKTVAQNMTTKPRQPTPLVVKSREVNDISSIEVLDKDDALIWQF